MVDSTEETMNDFVASPSTNKDSLPKEISDISDRYEMAIRQLVWKLVSERDTLQKANLELEAKLREATEQKEKDANVLTEFKRIALKEVNESRTKCQQLEAKLQAALTAAETGKSVEDNELNKFVEETMEAVMPLEADVGDDSQHQEMAVNDSIVISDD